MKNRFAIFNGTGKDLDSSMFHVPMKYTRVIHPSNKNKELVIVDIIKNMAIIAWNNNSRCRIGILKRIPIINGIIHYKNLKINVRKGFNVI